MFAIFILMGLIFRFLFMTRIGLCLVIFSLPFGIYQQWYDSKYVMTDAETPHLLKIGHVVAQDLYLRQRRSRVVRIVVTNTSPNKSTQPGHIWAACRTSGVMKDFYGNVMATLESLAAFPASFVEDYKGARPLVIPPNTTMTVEFDEDDDSRFGVRGNTILDDCRIGGNIKQVLAQMDFNYDGDDPRDHILTATPEARYKYSIIPGWRN